MSSIYPKFLGPITITSANNTFGYNDGAPQTVNITSGDYGSILEVCSNLDTQLGAGWTVTVSETGIVRIQRTSSWSADWANTDDALENLLGYNGTETVSSNILTATTQHEKGYYPGLLSWGYSQYKGTGFRNNFRWESVWQMTSVRSGDGTVHKVGPATAIYTANVTLGIIEAVEVDHVKGLQSFFDDHMTSQFRLYTDRDNGTVASPGTKNTHYYVVKLLSDTGIQPREIGRSNSHYICPLSFSKE